MPIGGGLATTMEHGNLSDRVEGLATGLVNEDSLLGDRRHHIVLDEIIHEVAGTPFVDVRHLVGELIEDDVVTPVAKQRVLVHEPSSEAFDSITQLAAFHRGWQAARDAEDD